MQDLVAGEIDKMSTDQVTALPQMRAGSIKGYAFTGRNRLTAAPDIPRVREAGLPEYYASVWNAIWAPMGTPNDIIARLNAAVIDALADPAARLRLADLSHQLFPRDEQIPEWLLAWHLGSNRHCGT
jgi:tripartite-type tricarboxylate transporter receptor subunit TctC